MMSHERFLQIKGGMTDQAMRVYDAVPWEEHWTAHQINGELVRLQVQMAPNAVAGCLDSLVRTGIVKENSHKFIRTKVRKPTVKKKTLEDLNELAKDLAASKILFAAMHPQEKIITTQPEEPLMNAPARTTIITPATLGLPVKAKSLPDMIGDLAQQMQAMAQRHREEMATLADLVADIAIDVQAAQEQHEKELGKFATLKAILKDMT